MAKIKREKPIKEFIKRFGPIKTAFSVIGGVLGIVGVTVLGVFFAGGFNEKVVTPESIEISYDASLYNQDYGQIETCDEFELSISGVSASGDEITQNKVTLSFDKNDLVITEGGYISNGIIKVPKEVTIGQPFTVELSQEYLKNDDGTYFYDNNERVSWIKGGISTLYATSQNNELTPRSIRIAVDTPVYKTETIVKNSSGYQTYNIITNESFTLETKFIPAKSEYMFADCDNENISEENARKKLSYYESKNNSGVLPVYDGKNDMHFIAGSEASDGITITSYTYMTALGQIEYQNAISGLSDAEYYNSNVVYLASSEDKRVSSTANISITKEGVDSFSVRANTITASLGKPFTIYAKKNNNDASNPYYLDAIIYSTSRATLDKLLGNLAIAFIRNGNDATRENGDIVVTAEASEQLSINFGENKVTLYKPNSDVSDLRYSHWDIVSNSESELNIEVRVYLIVKDANGEEILFGGEDNYAQLTMHLTKTGERDLSWQNRDELSVKLNYSNNALVPKTLYLGDYVSVPEENVYQDVIFFASFNGQNDDEAKKIIGESGYDELRSGMYNVDENEARYLYVINGDSVTLYNTGSFDLYFATITGEYNPDETYKLALERTCKNSKRIIVKKALSDASVDIENSTFDWKGFENGGNVLLDIGSSETFSITFKIDADSLPIFTEEFENGNIDLLIYSSSKEDITNYFIGTDKGSASLNQDDCTLTYTLRINANTKLYLEDQASIKVKCFTLKYALEDRIMVWALDANNTTLYNPLPDSVFMSNDSYPSYINGTKTITVEQKIQEDGFKTTINCDNTKFDSVSDFIDAFFESESSFIIKIKDQFGRSDTLADRWEFAYSDAEYLKTADITPIAGKTYFTFNGTAYTKVEDPNSVDIKSYYEKNNSGLVGISEGKILVFRNYEGIVQLKIKTNDVVYDKYVQASDSFDSNKTYYTKNTEYYNVVSEPNDDDIRNYYEFVELIANQYQKTSDLSVNSSKTYYTKDTESGKYIEVSSPNQGEISNYYERTSSDKVYVKTNDKNVVAEKTYYTYNPSRYIKVDNPSAEYINTYYVKTENYRDSIDGRVYFKTEDTSVNSGKTYYIEGEPGDFSIVEAPTGDPKTSNYYELGAIKLNFSVSAEGITSIKFQNSGGTNNDQPISFGDGTMNNSSSYTGDDLSKDVTLVRYGHEFSGISLIELIQFYHENIQYTNFTFKLTQAYLDSFDSDSLYEMFGYGGMINLSDGSGKNSNLEQDKDNLKNYLSGMTITTISIMKDFGKDHTIRFIASDTAGAVNTKFNIELKANISLESNADYSSLYAAVDIPLDTTITNHVSTTANTLGSHYTGKCYIIKKGNEDYYTLSEENIDNSAIGEVNNGSIKFYDIWSVNAQTFNIRFQPFSTSNRYLLDEVIAFTVKRNIQVTTKNDSYYLLSQNGNIGNYVEVSRVRGSDSLPISYQFSEYLQMSIDTKTFSLAENANLSFDYNSQQIETYLQIKIGGDALVLSVDYVEATQYTSTTEYYVKSGTTYSLASPQPREGNFGNRTYYIEQKISSIPFYIKPYNGDFYQELATSFVSNQNATQSKVKIVDDVEYLMIDRTIDSASWKFNTSAKSYSVQTYSYYNAPYNITLSNDGSQIIIFANKNDLLFGLGNSNSYLYLDVKNSTSTTLFTIRVPLIVSSIGLDQVVYAGTEDIYSLEYALTSPEELIMRYIEVPSSEIFDVNKVYYTESDGVYTKQTNLQAFAQGVKYYTYEPIYNTINAGEITQVLKEASVSVDSDGKYIVSGLFTNSGNSNYALNFYPLATVRDENNNIIAQTNQDLIKSISVDVSQISLNHLYLPEDEHMYLAFEYTIVRGTIHQTFYYVLGVEPDIAEKYVTYPFEVEEEHISAEINKEGNINLEEQFDEKTLKNGEYRFNVIINEDRQTNIPFLNEIYSVQIDDSEIIYNKTTTGGVTGWENYIDIYFSSDYSTLYYTPLTNNKFTVVIRHTYPGSTGELSIVGGEQFYTLVFNENTVDYSLRYTPNNNQTGNDYTWDLDNYFDGEGSRTITINLVENAIAGQAQSGTIIYGQLQVQPITKDWESVIGGYDYNPATGLFTLETEDYIERDQTLEFLVFTKYGHLGTLTINIKANAEYTNISNTLTGGTTTQFEDIFNIKLNNELNENYTVTATITGNGKDFVNFDGTNFIVADLLENKTITVEFTITFNATSQEFKFSQDFNLIANITGKTNYSPEENNVISGEIITFDNVEKFYEFIYETQEQLNTTTAELISISGDPQLYNQTSRSNYVNEITYLDLTATWQLKFFVDVTDRGYESGKDYYVRCYCYVKVTGDFEEGVIYYTFDSDNNQYTLAEGITEFDEGTDYYILSSYLKLNEFNSSLAYYKIEKANSFDGNKTYYYYSNGQYIQNSDVDSDYFREYFTFAKTDDTSVVNDKDYFTYDTDTDKYTKVTTPEDSNLSSYFEKSQATSFVADETYYYFDDEKYIKEDNNNHLRDYYTFESETISDSDSFSDNVYYILLNGRYVQVSQVTEFETGVHYYAISTQPFYTTYSLVVHPSVELSATYPSPTSDGMLDCEYIENGSTFDNLLNDFINHAPILAEGEYIEVDTKEVDSPVSGTTYYTRSGEEGSYVYTECNNLTEWAEDAEYYYIFPNNRIVAKTASVSNNAVSYSRKESVATNDLSVKIKSLTNAMVKDSANTNVLSGATILNTGKYTFARGTGAGEAIIVFEITYKTVVIDYTVKILDNIISAGLNTATNNTTNDCETIYVDKTSTENMFAEGRMAKVETLAGMTSYTGTYYLMFKYGYTNYYTFTQNTGDYNPGTTYYQTFDTQNTFVQASISNVNYFDTNKTKYYTISPRMTSYTSGEEYYYLNNDGVYVKDSSVNATYFNYYVSYPIYLSENDASKLLTLDLGRSFAGMNFVGAYLASALLDNNAITIDANGLINLTNGTTFNGDSFALTVNSEEIKIPNRKTSLFSNFILANRIQVSYAGIELAYIRYNGILNDLNISGISGEIDVKVENTPLGIFTYNNGSSNKTQKDLSSKDLSPLKYSYMPTIDFDVREQITSSLNIPDYLEANLEIASAVEYLGIYHPTTGMYVQKSDFASGNATISLSIVETTDNANSAIFNMYVANYGAFKQNILRNSGILTSDNKPYDFKLYPLGAKNDGDYVLVEIKYTSAGFNKSYYVVLKVLPDYVLKFGESESNADEETDGSVKYAKNSNPLVVELLNEDVYKDFMLTKSSNNDSGYLSVKHKYGNNTEGEFATSFKQITLTPDQTISGVVYNQSGNLRQKLFNDNSNSSNWADKELASKGYYKLNTSSPTKFSMVPQVIFGNQNYVIEGEDEYGFKYRVYFTLKAKNTDPQAREIELMEEEYFDVGASFSLLTISPSGSQTDGEPNLLHITPESTDPVNPTNAKLITIDNINAWLFDKDYTTDDDSNNYLNKNYAKATKYVKDTTYYTRSGDSEPYTYTQTSDVTAENFSTYYIKVGDNYQRATEYKDSETYYTRSGDSEPYTYTQTSDVTAENFSIYYIAAGYSYDTNKYTLSSDDAKYLDINNLSLNYVTIQSMDLYDKETGTFLTNVYTGGNKDLATAAEATDGKFTFNGFSGRNAGPASIDDAQDGKYSLYKLTGGTISEAYYSVDNNETFIKKTGLTANHFKDYYAFTEDSSGTYYLNGTTFTTIAPENYSGTKYAKSTSCATSFVSGNKYAYKNGNDYTYVSTVNEDYLRDYYIVAYYLDGNAFTTTAPVNYSGNKYSISTSKATTFESGKTYAYLNNGTYTKNDDATSANNAKYFSDYYEFTVDNTNGTYYLDDTTFKTPIPENYTGSKYTISTSKATTFESGKTYAYANSDGTYTKNADATNTNSAKYFSDYYAFTVDDTAISAYEYNTSTDTYSKAYNSSSLFKIPRLSTQYNLFANGNVAQVLLQIRLKYEYGDTIEYFDCPVVVSLQRGISITQQSKVVQDGNSFELNDIFTVSKDNKTTISYNNNLGNEQYNLLNDTLEVVVRAAGLVKFNLKGTFLDGTTVTKPVSVSGSGEGVIKTSFLSLSSLLGRTIENGMGIKIEFTSGASDCYGIYYITGDGNGRQNNKMYTLETETSVVSGRTYYTYSGGAYSVVQNPTGNPSELSYYYISGKTNSPISFNVSTITKDCIYVEHAALLASNYYTTQKYYVLQYQEGTVASAKKYLYPVVKDYVVTGKYYKLKPQTNQFEDILIYTDNDFASWSKYGDGQPSFIKAETYGQSDSDGTAITSSDYFKFSVSDEEGGSGIATINADSGKITLLSGWTSDSYLTVQLSLKVSGWDRNIDNDGDNCGVVAGFGTYKLGSPKNVTIVQYYDEGGLPFTGTSSQLSIIYREGETIATPTRAGYTFAGWYTDVSCTNEVTTYSSNTTVYYAKWSAANS